MLQARPALANIGLGEESKMASENHLKFHAKFENFAFKESPRRRDEIFTLALSIFMVERLNLGSKVTFWPLLGVILRLAWGKSPHLPPSLTGAGFQCE